MISIPPERKMEHFIKLMKQMDLHQKYTSKLISNGFDEWDLIKDLDSSLLKECGITSKLTQQEVLSCVQLAREMVPGNPGGPREKAERKSSPPRMVSQQSVRGESGDAMAVKSLLKGTQLAWNKKKQSYEQFLLSLKNFNMDNRGIEEIENLDKVRHIISLYLYDNQIRRITGLEDCTKIQILRLENNRIEKLEGLEQLSRLQKLYLNHNGISRIENLTTQYQLNELQMNHQHTAIPFSFCGDSCAVISESLQVLELDSCNIHSLQYAEYLANVHTLSLQNNRLLQPDALENLSACLRGLRVLRLQGNPLCGVPKHRDQVVMMASESLEELDGKDITASQRAFLFKFYNIKHHKAQQESQRQGTYLASLDDQGDKLR